MQFALVLVLMVDSVFDHVSGNVAQTPCTETYYTSRRTCSGGWVGWTWSNRCSYVRVANSNCCEGYSGPACEIYGPRSMYFTPAATSYREDENVDLQPITCSSQCWECEYNWTGPNSYTSQGSVLDLGRLRKSMTGSYSCKATNIKAAQQTQQSKNVTIEVRYAPVVSIRFSTTNLTEGASLTLYCDGSGVPSTYNYVSLSQKWNNFEIANNNTALSGTEQYSSIHFNQLQLQDTGTYTCTLNNGIRDTSGTLNQTSSRNMSVEIVPRVLKDELRFTGATGGVAQIQVPVYSFPDLETATFTTYDDKTITSSNKYNITNQPDTVITKFYGTPVSLNGNIIGLTIKDLDETDFGNYSLKLTNRLHVTTVTVYVIAEESTAVSSRTAPLAAGVTSAVVVIVLVVSSIFIWKNRSIIRAKCDRKSLKGMETDNTTEENSYYNTLRSHLQPDEGESRYEDLPRISATNSSENYESMQRRDEGMSSYSTLSHTADNVQITSANSNKENIYVNLELKEM